MMAFNSAAGLSDVQIKAEMEIPTTALAAYGDVTSEPNGFPNRTDSTISFDAGTRTFTIAPTGTSFDYYFEGVKVTVPEAQTVTFPDTAGLWFIYFDASGVLTASQTLWQFNDDQIFVAIVLWDGTNGRIQEERHGLVMDWATHQRLHYTYGAEYSSGLAVSSIDNTSFVISSGVIFDEDIKRTITEQTQAIVLYRDPTAAYETWQAKSTLYYVENAGILQYDTGAGLANVDSNKYMAMFAVATLDPDSPIYWLAGQNQDTKISDARENNQYGDLALPDFAQEVVPIARVILRNAAGTTTYVETLDLRGTINAPGGTVTAQQHNALDGRDARDSHPSHAVTSQTNAKGNVSGAVTLDANNEKITATLTADVTGITITNAPSTVTSVIWEVTDAQAYAIAWPTGTTFAGSAAPSIFGSVCAIHLRIDDAGAIHVAGIEDDIGVAA